MLKIIEDEVSRDARNFVSDLISDVKKFSSVHRVIEKVKVKPVTGAMPVDLERYPFTMMFKDDGTPALIKVGESVFELPIEQCKIFYMVTSKKKGILK